MANYTETEGQRYYPNYAAEMKSIKEQMEIMALREQRLKKLKKTTIKLDINCTWCGEQITNESEDCYYKCEMHKTVFCHKCAWNFYETVIERSQAPKCRQDLSKPHVDCIYKKIKIRAEGIEGIESPQTPEIL